MSTSDAINKKHVGDALLNIREAIECLQVCITSTAIESEAASVASCVMSKLEESATHLDRPWIEGGAS